MKKVVGNTAAATPLAAVVAWGWNILYPETPMSAEVAVSLAGLLGIAVAYAVSWLPHPE